jgi:class 3 adenylate cyclase
LNINAFEGVTDALQEDTIVYLNQISEVIHTQVDIYNGVSNKNLGDTYLLVWKVPILDDNFEGDLDNTILDEGPIADLSIVGAMKVFAKINAYTHITHFMNEYED